MENPVNNFARDTTQVICDTEQSRGEKKKVCQKQEMDLKLSVVGGGLLNQAL